MVRRLEVCISDSADALKGHVRVLVQVFATLVSLLWSVQVSCPTILDFKQLLAAALPASEYDFGTQRWAMGLIGTGILATVLGFVLLFPAKNSGTETVSVVSIYPTIGIELRTELLRRSPEGLSQTTKKVLNVKFIPRDQIFDCIVYEVILVHKVINLVAFRIHKADNSVKDDKHIEEIVNNKALQLVPAFPGAEMTYKECLHMRSEIIHELGIHH